MGRGSSGLGGSVRKSGGGVFKTAQDIRTTISDRAFESAMSEIGASGENAINNRMDSIYTSLDNQLKRNNLTSRDFDRAEQRADDAAAKIVGIKKSPTSNSYRYNGVQLSTNTASTLLAYQAEVKDFMLRKIRAERNKRGL